MSKKIQCALALIIVGAACLLTAVRCSSFRWLHFGWRRQGILLNEQWVDRRTEADYETGGIVQLAVTNTVSPVRIIRNTKSGVITVKTAGLPDTAIEVSSKDGILSVTEEDIRRWIQRRVSYRYRDWYIDSEITVAVPDTLQLTDIRLAAEAPLQMENIKADSVQISGSASPSFTVRQCRFRTLFGKMIDARMEMRNAAIDERIVFHSEDGSILLYDVKAPSAEFTTDDGRIQVTRIACDELVCRTADGSVTVNGTVTKKADISSGDGSLSLNLEGSALTEQLKLYTKDGSITLKNLSAPSADIETGDGRIRTENVSFNTVRCRSGDGSIGFSGIVTDTADFSTGSGSITADLSQCERTAKLLLHSKDGSITLKNATAASAELTTNDGSCTAERCFLTDARIEASNIIRLDGDLNGTCRLTSKDGDIRLSLNGTENDYAIASGRRKDGSTVVGNITIKRSTQSAENFPIVAGSADAPNKLFLSADNGNIHIKTQ